MGRRTKAEILEDEEFTCSNKKCNKKIEEAYLFTHYNQLAKLKELDNISFCKECFLKKEMELNNL